MNQQHEFEQELQTIKNRNALAKVIKAKDSFFRKKIQLSSRQYFSPLVLCILTRDERFRQVERSKKESR